MPVSRTKDTITETYSPNQVDEKQRRDSPYLSVREVAQYLNINTKKIYALASEGKSRLLKLRGSGCFPENSLTNGS